MENSNWFDIDKNSGAKRLVLEITWCWNILNSQRQARWPAFPTSAFNYRSDQALISPCNSWAPSWCRRHRTPHNRTQTYCLCCIPRSFVLLFPIDLQQLCLLHQPGNIVWSITEFSSRSYIGENDCRFSSDTSRANKIFAGKFTIQNFAVQPFGWGCERETNAVFVQEYPMRTIATKITVRMLKYFKSLKIY